eukprot:TRINITY_DN10513_c0_g1_i1.p1 TRINITY_DN10513_c0_g1~~TRINITY_DN10513_c0_g1_i1.p1  ORF type:complete len:235 (-),score=44.04 TRINITY_DN10513_c0_g1_i1:90-752(-)
MKKKLHLETELYNDAVKVWPSHGKHILAQYDDDSILVYQAYSPSIGKYAATHQSFMGCTDFSSTRMTWIKTNFLWMMYRSGWGTKSNQEITLGIWLKREAFEKILEHAVHSSFQPDQFASKNDYNKSVAEAKKSDFGFVRLQWDPDHHPSGSPHPNRRAIQLGLKQVKSFYEGDAIVQILDLTDFVAENRSKSVDELIIPKERVYPVPEAIAKKIGLDST